MSSDVQLTLRELVIAIWVKSRVSNERIADKLGINEATLAVHLNRILRKLDMDSRDTLARTRIQDR